MTYDLFIFAGEASGDIHGAAILKALKKLRPDIRVSGVAGPKMRKEGLSLFMPMENFRVMGFTDVFKNIFSLLRSFRKILRHILSTNPKAVLFIDYPGFNLRMAKALRKKGFSQKLIHYICPTVWAHGKKRIHTLSDTLDLLLSIFPFEKKYFAHVPLQPVYIGNPLIDTFRNHVPDVDWRTSFSIPREAPLVGIFPGSRVQEIKQNLPKILRSCEIFSRHHPDHLFVLSVADPSLKYYIEKAIAASSLLPNQTLFPVPGTKNKEMMKEIECAIATSGTITFELGIASVPTAVVYHLTTVNAWIAGYCLKLNLPYYCIVNIIMEKLIFPEMYYLDFLPEKVAEALEGFYVPEKKEQVVQGCRDLLSLMDRQKEPSSVAAGKIHELIYASGK